jgi:hypothetical protein
MTTPEPEMEPMPTPVPVAPVIRVEPLEEPASENPILGWAKAIVGGIGDTAKDMLDEGRRGAHEAMENGWERFDAKTKRRRK